MSSKSSQPSMKQSKLSFGASKSTAPANKAKKEAGVVSKPSAAESSSTTSTRPKRAAALKDRVVDIESSEEEPNVDDIELAESEPSSESEIEKDEDEFSDDKCQKEVATVEKRETRASKVKAKEAVAPPKVLGVPADSRPVKKETKTVNDQVEQEAASRPNLNIKSRAYDKISNETKQKMGHAHTIHPTTKDRDGKNVPLNRVDDILRVFDMSYEYGPSVGMTRLERWERAKTMGLSPPPEIYDILTTEQGLKEERYAQNVLYGRV